MAWTPPEYQVTMATFRIASMLCAEKLERGSCAAAVWQKVSVFSSILYSPVMTGFASSETSTTCTQPQGQPWISFTKKGATPWE
jgi:hypothetical protein